MPKKTDEKTLKKPVEGRSYAPVVRNILLSEWKKVQHGKRYLTAEEKMHVVAMINSQGYAYSKEKLSDWLIKRRTIELKRAHAGLPWDDPAPVAKKRQVLP